VIKPLKAADVAKLLMAAGINLENATELQSYYQPICQSALNDKSVNDEEDENVTEIFDYGNVAFI